MIQKRVVEINHDWIWLAAIVLTGFCLRVVTIAGFNHTPVSDELAYKSMALNLLAGYGILEEPAGNRAHYNVGYPIFILAPVFYFFGENILAARIANLLLGGISIVLCYFVAKEAGAGKIGRLLAAAIWALYLPTGVYGVYLAKENLMVPLMLGVMWCALRFATDPTLKVAAGCGALFGLLALTGNAALSLAGVVVIALIVAPRLAKQRLIALGVVLSVALLVATPWMLRNWYVIGAPVLNTNGGFNLYLGNNPAATGFFVGIQYTPRGPTWHELRRTAGELEASRTLKREAISWIKDHPKEFVLLALKKGAYFWTPPFHEGKGGNRSTAESLVRIAWSIQFIVLVVAAIGSVFIPRLRNKQLLLLWLAIACYTAVHMLFYVIFRYRHPIMPIVGIMAALAIESFLLARVDRKTLLKIEPQP